MSIHVLHGEPVDVIQLTRLHNGLALNVSPHPPVLAETPEEALLVLADWLGMPKPGKPRQIGDENRTRYPWSAPKIVANVGAQMTVMKARRGRSETEFAFMVTTHHALPNTAWQAVLWTPMHVMERANAWMSSIAANTPDRLDAVRFVGELDFDDDDVFVLNVQHNENSESSAGKTPAAWTVTSSIPPIEFGVERGPVADFFASSMGDAQNALFLARLKDNTLEIGQQYTPDLGDA